MRLCHPSFLFVDVPSCSLSAHENHTTIKVLALNPALFSQSNGSHKYQKPNNDPSALSSFIKTLTLSIKTLIPLNNPNPVQKRKKIRYKSLNKDASVSGAWGRKLFQLSCHGDGYIPPRVTIG